MLFSQILGALRLLGRFSGFTVIIQILRTSLHILMTY